MREPLLAIEKLEKAGESKEVRKIGELELVKGELGKVRKLEEPAIALLLS